MSNCVHAFGRGKVICSFCKSEKYSVSCSEWNGDVICCVDCAKSVLPAMIADAVHLPPEKNATYLAESLWDGVLKAAFYRAILSRSVVKKLPSRE